MQPASFKDWKNTWYSFWQLARAFQTRSCFNDAVLLQKCFARWCISSLILQTLNVDSAASIWHLLFRRSQHLYKYLFRLGSGAATVPLSLVGIQTPYQEPNQTKASGPSQPWLGSSPSRPTTFPHPRRNPTWQARSGVPGTIILYSNILLTCLQELRNSTPSPRITSL